jgi:hypothetical protein
MTPTARSLAHLRAEGWHVSKVEQTVPRTFIKRDAFGWADLLAVHPLKGIALVQVTSGSNLAARLKKARGIGALVAWVTAGGKLVAHGWAKRGPRGEPKRWTLREIELRIEDLTAHDVTPKKGEIPA